MMTETKAKEFSEEDKEAEEETKKKIGKKKKATDETLATITDDYKDIFVFLQAFTVKSLQLIEAPLSLCSDKCARLVPPVV